jgi:hypothetical protein
MSRKRRGRRRFVNRDPTAPIVGSIAVLARLSAFLLSRKRFMLQKLEALPHAGDQVFREVSEIFID